jgi:hypothetical protein
LHWLFYRKGAQKSQSNRLSCQSAEKVKERLDQAMTFLSFYKAKMRCLVWTGSFAHSCPYERGGFRSDGCLREGSGRSEFRQ